MRLPSGAGALRAWPFLTMALLMFGLGINLISNEESKSEAGEALFILGAVLIGAWVALLAGGNVSEAVRGWKEPDDDPDG